LISHSLQIRVSVSSLHTFSSLISLSVSLLFSYPFLTCCLLISRFPTSTLYHLYHGKRKIPALPTDWPGYSCCQYQTSAIFVPFAPSSHPNQLLQKLGAPHNPDLPISVAFSLVALQRGWKPGSNKWKKNWNTCMNSEYDRLIGCRVSSLATWQELCTKVGIEDSFTSINQCKKVMS
jgi:hypothetical protein